MIGRRDDSCAVGRRGCPYQLYREKSGHGYVGVDAVADRLGGREIAFIADVARRLADHQYITLTDGWYGPRIGAIASITRAGWERVDELDRQAPS